MTDKMATKKVKLENVLDSRVVLEAALEVSGRSKYAFARAAGMSPSSLNEYFKVGKRQMTARKLEGLLRSNGIKFTLSMDFDEINSAGLHRPEQTQEPRIQVQAACHESPALDKVG